MNNSKNWIQILKSEVSRYWGGSHCHSGTRSALLSHCELAQGRLASLFKIWIYFLKLFINLIRNDYVFANTILKHLYWSEFDFLVLLWLFCHLLTFLKSKQFQSDAGQWRPSLKSRNTAAYVIMSNFFRLNLKWIKLLIQNHL